METNQLIVLTTYSCNSTDDDEEQVAEYDPTSMTTKSKRRQVLLQLGVGLFSLPLIAAAAAADSSSSSALLALAPQTPLAAGNLLICPSTFLINWLVYNGIFSAPWIPFLFHASFLLIVTYIFLDDASQEFRLYLDDVNKFKILIPPGAPKYLFLHGIQVNGSLGSSI